MIEHSSRNPFLDSSIAASYENWYLTSGRKTDDQEKAILRWLLDHFPGACTLLEVGCGTGHFTRWFGKQGLQVVGLDLSASMLKPAKTLDGEFYLQGDAVTLPFPTGSFDLVAFITTLEFLSEPVQALADALRVARLGIILGVLNARSRLGRRYQHKGGPIWGTARLYSVPELKQMIFNITGSHARINWQTTLWPCWSSALPLPRGGFIGMAVNKQKIAEEI